MVKNPNWRETDHFAVYKRRREDEFGAFEKNISHRSERDLNPRPTDFKSYALTTRPRCLPKLFIIYHLLLLNIDNEINWRIIRMARAYNGKPSRCKLWKTLYLDRSKCLSLKQEIRAGNEIPPREQVLRGNQSEEASLQRFLNFQHLRLISSRRQHLV